MYQKFRALHLFFGLLISAFLVLYSASAFMMGHSFLFKFAYPKPVNKTISVETAKGAMNIVDEIRDREDMYGDLHQVKTTSTSLSFFVERPGSRFDVNFDVASGTATITAYRGGIWFTMDRMHHTGGIYHDEPAVVAWGWFVFFASLILMGVGVSGVYMWFKRNRERRVGGYIFIASFLFAGILLFLVRVV